MFKRNIVAELETWLANKGRKPLVLRGASKLEKRPLLINLQNGSNSTFISISNCLMTGSLLNSLRR